MVCPHFSANGPWRELCEHAVLVSHQPLELEKTMKIEIYTFEFHDTMPP